MNNVLKLLITSILILALNSIPVYSAEARTYGELLYNSGIVYGLDKGLEEANDITRSEMIVLLVRMLVGESGFNSYVLPEIPSFNDVPASHWAYTEIEIAKQIGITSGLDDGSFGIDLPVTYAQTVLFLARALHYDTSAMPYNNSVYLIREATGLTLKSNVGPHVALKRGQVFELISHALSKNIKDTNQLLLSSLTIDGNLGNQFLIDYPDAVQSNVPDAYAENSEDLMNFENGYQYSSYDLYAKSLALIERYPQILEMEILGYSTDKRPIYVIRMTNPINESSENSYVGKMHIFVDAGVHARETYNPFLVLRIIEDYAKDYYNNAVIPSADINAMLQNNVIHFMPLLNPDGFDIVKFGPGMIKDPVLKAHFIQLLGRNDYRRLKANVRGVDLNRNYADDIFDTNTSLW
ncbi:MAG: S-layer homology domain-containing protein, partial [Peptostreptococcaceae bacterium]|nr:S-layer homology domain-containing protein [Peptostreptococcaceae bacterium]